MNAEPTGIRHRDGKTACLARDLMFGWFADANLESCDKETRADYEDALVKLASIASSRTLLPDETLYVEGEGIERCYEVISGCLRRISILPDGRRHVVTFLHRGDLLGVGPEETYPHTVEAVGEAQLLSFPRIPFAQIASQNDALRTAITRSIAQKARRTTDHFRIVACFSAVDRVAAFLLDYARAQACLRRRAGEIGPDYTGTTHLPMPRRDIADHLGLSLETVCRAITKLRTIGLIKMPEPHTFAIPSTGRLEAYFLEDKAA